MTDSPNPLTPAQMQLVARMQHVFEGCELPDIHAAMVCLYVQMVLMCSSTPREAKVLVNRMAEDMKTAVVDNMPKVKAVQ